MKAFAVIATLFLATHAQARLGDPVMPRPIVPPAKGIQASLKAEIEPRQVVPPWFVDVSRLDQPVIPRPVIPPAKIHQARLDRPVIQRPQRPQMPGAGEMNHNDEAMNESELIKEAKARPIDADTQRLADEYGVDLTKLDYGTGDESDFDTTAPGAAEAVANYEGFEDVQAPEIDAAAWMNGDFKDLIHNASLTDMCPVHAVVSKRSQSFTLYRNGMVVANWLTSTGRPGHSTPNFVPYRVANGKFARGRPGNPDYHDSSRYPGGGIPGFGNMPYAVFFTELIAVHGTAAVRKLGTPDSHGCLRLEAANAKVFNRMVRAHGASNSCLTVQ